MILAKYKQNKRHFYCASYTISDQQQKVLVHQWSSLTGTIISESFTLFRWIEQFRRSCFFVWRHWTETRQVQRIKDPKCQTVPCIVRARCHQLL